ncbi:MAG: ribonuclease J [Candidatus Kerfeldbacteria bacterium]|nr:ribonuclease J [Candidatus Kerfeldbacteria bacterium]
MQPTLAPSRGQSIPPSSRRRRSRRHRSSPKNFGGGSGKKVNIIVLGGAEEVGRNCTLIEYEDDIIIIDAGLQFPEEDMPGIDYIIPNIAYLRGKEKNVRGMLITHGHYDHIVGIPHMAPRLGNPPIFGTKLTLAIIKKRQDDFKNTPPLNLRVIDPTKYMQLGKFRVEFFRVNHNIPDCIGFVVKTPEGTIVHTGDMKFDYTPVIDPPADYQRIAEVGKEGVALLLSDSTNAANPGHQLSERAIGADLRDIIHKAKGRVIVGTFSSLLSRIQQVIWFAEECGRKVVIDGFSMKTNVEISRTLGYLTVNPRTLISPHEANKLPPEKVLIMCTGAQGEDRAVLMRIATREHRFFRLEKGDTVVFSSSVVPGNERTVARLRDSLIREGANVFHYKMMDIHAGGHSCQEDLKLLFSLLKPKYVVPIMGEIGMTNAAISVAKSIGWTDETALMTFNGRVMELSNGHVRLTQTKVPTDYVFVDGLGVGDVSDVVLRDRLQMADEGMVVIIASVDAQTGKLIGEPDIISRGFVYMKNSKRLIDETRAKVKDILTDKSPEVSANESYLRNKIRDDIGQFLFTRTERRPMVLPVIFEV